MYEYIRGDIQELTPASVVIEAGGIGYHVLISVHTFTALQALTREPGKNDLSRLLVHQVVREDAHLLYGFSSSLERELFRLLISVSGVGPNTARIILSSSAPSEIQNAISTANVNLLKSFKGIGLKTAQRIILDLRDKIGLVQGEGENFPGTNNTLREEALSALVTLGFTKANVEKVLDKIQTGQNPPASVEEMVKTALKGL
jgi:holliday junction DNA helicase RuvA